MALALVGATAASLPANVGENYANAVKVWQSRALATINHKIGFVHGAIEHPFPGRKNDRGYLSRWNIFLEHGFNPHTDLKWNTRWVLEFAGNKPDLERAFDRYLRARNEDVNALD